MEAKFVSITPKMAPAVIPLVDFYRKLKKKRIYSY